MKHLFFIIILFAGVSSWGQQYLSTKSATISFVSDAELELIRAASDNCRGILNIENQEFAFQVDIDTFEGFNNPLQKEHFNENYMEEPRFPKAVFKGRILEPIEFGFESVIWVRAKGDFTIHGVSEEKIIDVRLIPQKDGFDFDANFEVMLQTHGIEIPRVVHHKIADSIAVSVSGNLIK